MRIGPIDLNKQVMVVAEIGNNHEGSFALAVKMIHLAVDAGADAVKFQTIAPDRLVSFQQQERIEQLRRYQLSYEQFAELADVARKAGVLFLSTPFDLDSARFLTSLVPAFKIASGDNNFLPLLQCVAETGKPIIFSAGLACMDDIRRSKAFIETVWTERDIASELAILHCVVSYPTAPADANLLAIPRLAELGATVGYSDHTLGIEASVLAVAVGARIIEKHFTVSKQHSEFRDHQLSADPAELRELVERIRAAEQMLGDGKKERVPAEEPLAEAARRSIVAARDLSAGVVLTWNDLDWVRPAGGLKPGQENRLVGRALHIARSRGEMILPEHVAEHPTSEPCSTNASLNVSSG